MAVAGILKRHNVTALRDFMVIHVRVFIKVKALRFRVAYHIITLTRLRNLLFIRLTDLLLKICHLLLILFVLQIMSYDKAYILTFMT